MPDTSYYFVVPKVDLSAKNRGERPKKYNVKRSEYAKLTREMDKLNYLGFRPDVMCKHIVSG